MECLCWNLREEVITGADDWNCREWLSKRRRRILLSHICGVQMVCRLSVFRLEIFDTGFLIANFVLSESPPCNSSKNAGDLITSCNCGIGPWRRISVNTNCTWNSGEFCLFLYRKRSPEEDTTNPLISIQPPRRPLGNRQRVPRSRRQRKY